ncbi:hypothetical protein SASPL_153611 [Salvia splendens]|uniref:Uncharacterized protein n=1 Tax=Salvia splendens TaxID=180675 RepID=A0A8X8YYI2_SALSN|nr:uncharacterized protein LOC121787804 [Salvia splendens]KAG6384793.1 hypothetical protein SASPL_153611 [Salvia splendens]
MEATAPAADKDETIERLLEAPMTWIGTYVAAASLICAAAMAADTIQGLWKKKRWFPSKYFPLNATSLTLLAVAMKLPVDLTTRMYTVTDRLAKISSIAFLSAAVANFLTSLGAMADKEVLSNAAALAVLVITVFVNVTIQIIQMHSYLQSRRAFLEEIIVIALMLLLILMFVSSAAMIVSTKPYLEKKYHEMCRSAADENGDDGFDAERVITADKLRVCIKKHWMIAETGNPQFVLARSVTCSASGLLTLLIALVLLEAEFRMAKEFDLNILDQANSSYGWSTKLVLLTQTAGVIVAAIAPTMRWLTACRRSFTTSVTVESYWTQKMVELKQSSLSSQIQNLKWRKAIHILRGQFLQICISLQHLTVFASKLLLLLSLCFTAPIISFISYASRLKIENRVSQTNPQLDLSKYAMLLEGEEHLRSQTLDKICKEVDQVIEKGRSRKPKNLLKLLSKSSSFKGVTQFDSNEIPSLHSQGFLPHCWSLPLVTLSCVALAFPNADKSESDLLLRGVAEGLPLVKLVDKILDKKGRLASVRHAADVAWVELELYHMWQDKDLNEWKKNAREIVEELASRGEKTVVGFVKGTRNCVMRNPLNWPANVIGADAMYRVARTILLRRGEGEGEGDEALFEEVCVAIADILAACLTNMVEVIRLKCHSKKIEKRERSVRRAALLLGETEEISLLLQQRQVPALDANKAVNIEEWRRALALAQL